MMKKYETIILEIIRLNQYEDIICTSGPLEAGELDNEDIWGEEDLG